MLSFPHGPEDIPIIGALKHFIPCVKDHTIGLCSTICRVNHTCYSPKGSPNASYFWNTISKEEELYAIKEIKAGEEIEVSYMSNVSDFKPPVQHLCEKYALSALVQDVLARLPTCLHPRSELQHTIVLSTTLPSRFGPDNPLEILEDINRQILVISAEGWTSDIGSRAHDAFQLCASYGDAASARKWEAISRDSHALYQGRKSDSFKRAKDLATNPQGFHAWRQLGRRNLKGPSEEVLQCFYLSRVDTAQDRLNETLPSAVSIPTSGAAQGSSPDVGTDAGPSASTAAHKLSKGQKKKAKAKAKKEAARNAEES
ncbi:hypothetical protein B0H14DRAFT_2856990 [Mycena olivaceomarginata]|nr:hypothetical protein B0H14DRAFT_2856990 [Mycena olivaceomarginata]